MRKVILHRFLPDFEKELEVSTKYLFTTNSRLDIKPNDLVIGRYSSLPYFEEQARDIEKAGAKLINSYKQHCYVADLGNWTEDLEDLTPKSWHLDSIPANEAPFIVKGATNSRKHRWNKDMFAATKERAIEIAITLSNDGLIGQQDIYIRKYEPLVTYAKALHELPITREYRFFVAYEKILCGGYYWSSHLDVVPAEVLSIDCVPRDLLFEVIKRVGSKINFYTIDVAQKVNGEWIVIELNDGMMSGPSENNLDDLYSGLAALEIK